jgi:hypothetical protein
MSIVDTIQNLSDDADEKHERRSSLKKLGSPSLPRNVSFDKVIIKEFAITLGDNPMASGAPLTIEWDHQTNDVFEFEEYQNGKPESRCRTEFLIPAAVRAAMLHNQGTSRTEIVERTKEMKKIQKSRKDCVKSMKWDGVNEALEYARRKAKKVATRPLSYTSPKTSRPVLLEV